MSRPAAEVMDLIFGHWRSQTLYAGVKLGIFAHLADGRRSAGDMFEGVPEADGYLTKHILHDWSDEECVQILRRQERRSS